MPPIYAISLARAQTQRENITRRLDALGADYEIVDAVDGMVLDPSEYANRLRQDKCRIIFGCELTRSEIGCFLSHHNLWRRIAGGGDECALVVEDDAVWGCDFADVIGALMQSEWLWDVALLSPANTGGRISRVLCELPGGRKLVRYQRQAYSAIAYLISRTGAAKLHDYCEEIRAPIDVLYGEYWSNGVEFYGVEPALVRQSGEESLLPGREQARAFNLTAIERIRASLRRKTKRLRRAFFNLTNPPQKR